MACANPVQSFGAREPKNTFFIYDEPEKASRHGD